MDRLVPACALAMLAVASLWGSPAGATPEIVDYDVAVEVTEPDTLVDVTADVRFRLQPPTEDLHLLFSSRASALGAEASVGGACMPLQVSQVAGDSLVVVLPEVLRGDDTLHLHLRYSLPRRAAPRFTYLSRSHRWVPQIVDQIAPFRLRVDLPEGWTSYSGGDLLAHSTSDSRRRMAWASETPVSTIQLAIAPATALRDEVVDADGIAFHFVSSRADTAAARQVLREAVRAFAYFRGLLGDFPYRRFTVFETPEWTGTDIGSGIIAPGEVAVDAFLAGHEDELRLALTSQWVGAGIFPRSLSPGFWFLQISLPCYLRLMYERETEGEVAFTGQMEEGVSAYRHFAGTDADVPILEIATLDAPPKGVAIYGKGPYVVDRLARRLGDGPWRAALRELYAHYRGRALTCAELCAWLDARDPAGRPGARLQTMLAAKGLPVGD